MKKIIIWLLFILALLMISVMGYSEEWFKLKSSLILPYKSVVSAGFGGLLYLFRAMYVQKCVHKRWDKEWELWYYLRPFTSLLSGIGSYIFLKAGVLVLNAEIEISTSSFGFMAVAFIAGLNVDKFVDKLEDLAKATWGVDKTRMNSKKQDDEKPT